jgi:hypothetical protein
MRDQCTQRVDESIREMLDRAAPVNILAIAPRRVQLAVNNMAIDFQQISPGLPRAAIETSVQAGLKYSGRKHLVQLAPIIKTNFSARKFAQSLDNVAVAVQVSQQAIAKPIARDPSQLLFRSLQIGARVVIRPTEDDRKDRGEPAYSARDVNVLYKLFAAVTFEVDQESTAEHLRESGKQHIVNASPVNSGHIV